MSANGTEPVNRIESAIAEATAPVAEKIIQEQQQPATPSAPRAPTALEGLVFEVEHLRRQRCDEIIARSHLMAENARLLAEVASSERHLALIRDQAMRARVGLTPSARLETREGQLVVEGA